MWASATFEVRSPKRLQVMFTETSVATPTLVDADLFPTIPASVDVFGQMVDTSQLASALEPWQALAKGALGAVGEAAWPGSVCSPRHNSTYA